MTPHIKANLKVAVKLLEWAQTQPSVNQDTMREWLESNADLEDPGKLVYELVKDGALTPVA